MDLTRKQFLLLLAGGTAAAACGGSSGGNCAKNGSQTAVSANHGHVMTVTQADIAAGVDKTYDIQGTADHTHHVTLTAADFAKLAANQQAGETSDSPAVLPHTHQITVSCV